MQAQETQFVSRYFYHFESGSENVWSDYVAEFSPAEKLRLAQLSGVKHTQFIRLHTGLHWLLDTVFKLTMSERQSIICSINGKWHLPLSLVREQRESSASSSLFFSLSHCKNCFVFAFAAFPLGVDIEKERYDFDALGLSQKFLHPQEYQFIAEQDEKEQYLHFLILWTLKESYIKQQGGRIELLLKHLDFSVLQHNDVLERKRHTLKLAVLGNTFLLDWLCINDSPYLATISMSQQHGLISCKDFLISPQATLEEINTL